MKKIALISDNHGYVGDDVLKYLKDKDEIWHAGDIGSMESIQPIIDMTPKFRAVYGNIDSGNVRTEFPLNEVFECEGVKVFMTHIGGYPPKYKNRVRDIILTEKPNLYICGHSHITKVMRDRDYDLIHMNPGAYGHHGFHKMRTILTFSLDEGKIGDLNVIELGIRGIMKKGQV